MITELTIDIAIATIKVVPKEANAKLAPTKTEVRLRMSALTTMLNNPNVSNVIGSESRIKKGLTITFNIPNTILAPSAVQMLPT